MHDDHRPYARFTSKANLDKSVNSLLGIIEGIAIDGRINELELSYLNLWVSEHQEVRFLHPFNELIPVVERSISDGELDREEREDIRWLCERLQSREFYDAVSADLQRLHAILGGIIADTRISEDELRGLSDWLADHEHLKTCWPFDEIQSLVTGVLVDGRIDEEEHEMLGAFFADFTSLLDDRTITSAPIKDGGAIMGLCATDPDVVFDQRGFCFTGASAKFSRQELEAMVTRLGGVAHASPSKKVHYVVVGGEGNPYWAFACYGRKIEKAVKLRKEGHRVVIIHELDFHDAVADGS
ncbi:NAD-dependent DNA ligase [Stenotrophomonas panacihumi]|uniref:NAD-dependent DNA ligase n=1 Tax=Stenotrophomonas panacihumi TaxID=676599 RepID=A0A0R0AAK9_9GAMM|nr:BRCT domain-containing protein [Stenotrophomonas panacihumi]KRG38894.1 NAD-dependent DNA ligase [Stenotrophomonas panacihumi]PTN54890.1 NAD-dependent DNA ligase [Stenotrophomonas panacihumi]